MQPCEKPLYSVQHPRKCIHQSTHTHTRIQPSVLTTHWLHTDPAVCCCPSPCRASPPGSQRTRSAVSRLCWVVMVRKPTGPESWMAMSSYWWAHRNDSSSYRKSANISVSFQAHREHELIVGFVWSMACSHGAGEDIRCIKMDFKWLVYSEKWLMKRGRECMKSPWRFIHKGNERGRFPKSQAFIHPAERCEKRTRGAATLTPQ